jgi:coatomer subunit delta
MRLAEWQFYLSVHITIKESVALSLSREGGLESMELKGEMNLLVSDPSLTKLKLALAAPTTEFGSDLQFKQHPNVAKFAANKERVVALKDPSRDFPVNQSLGVLKWRYKGSDESLVPLSSTFCLMFPTQLP